MTVGTVKYVFICEWVQMTIVFHHECNCIKVHSEPSHTLEIHADEIQSAQHSPITQERYFLSILQLGFRCD